MSLLEETYRKIDPDGIINMAYEDTETKGSQDVRNRILYSAKDEKNPMEA